MKSTVMGNVMRVGTDRRFGTKTNVALVGVELLAQVSPVVQ